MAKLLTPPVEEPTLGEPTNILKYVLTFAGGVTINMTCFDSTDPVDEVAKWQDPEFHPDNIEDVEEVTDFPTQQ